MEYIKLKYDDHESSFDKELFDLAPYRSYVDGKKVDKELNTHFNKNIIQIVTYKSDLDGLIEVSSNYKNDIPSKRLTIHKYQHYVKYDHKNDIEVVLVDIYDILPDKIDSVKRVYVYALKSDVLNKLNKDDCNSL